MRKARRSLAILLAVVMVLCMVPAMGFAADNGDSEAVTRIDGNNRWDTAAKTALEKFGTADKVIVARGDDEGNFADGLAASYLAKVKDAPILLTNPNSLPQETKNAIKQLEATTAYVLGGELAVSEAVFSELKGLELDVERIDGGNRFDTAAKIAREGGNVDTALVVSGNAPADSLIAGSVAFNNGYPILLVQKDNVPDATDEAIKDLGIKNTYVVGGELVVSGAVYDQLGAKARYCGTKDTSRVGTSIDVAQKLFEEPKTFSIVGRQDKNLADAVGAAVLGNPIIYVGDDISGIQEYLAEVLTDDTQFVILGGTLAVSEAVQVELEELLVPEEVELNVESVSAIDTTKVVTVKATAPNAEEGATATVAIFAYDEEGVRGETAEVTVEDVEIVEGAIEVEVDAVAEALASGDYVAVVTVGEEEAELDFTLDFEAVDAAVAAVNTADTQIKLAAALQNEYFVDVYVEANIVAYAAGLGTSYETAQEVIDAVVAINEAEAAADKFVEVEEALNEAYPNQLTIISILDENFGAVNADYIVDYIDAIYDTSTPGSEAVYLTSMAEIQYAIDLVNATKAVEAAETAVAELAGDGNDTQADIDAVQVLHDAAFDLVDALNDSAEKTSLEGDLTAVQASIDAAQTALDDMNAAIEAAEAALEAYEIAGGDVEALVYTDLVDALEAETKVLGDITTATTALEAETTALTAVADAEAAQEDYLAAGGADTDSVYTDVSSAITTYEGDKSSANLTALQTATEALEAATNELIVYTDVMAAETATEMRALLFDLDSGNAYLNLSSAKKTEFAAYVLDALAAEETAPADFTELQSKVFGAGGYLETYEGLISDVNGASDIAGMITALTALENEAFDALTTAEQADVADTVLADKPYETLADIEATIDAAIAGL